MTKKILSHFEWYSRYYLLGAMALYIAFFSWLGYLKFIHFSYNGLDLAIINQVFFNSSRGNFFASTIHEATYLKDHFSPILFFLLPFYRVAQSPMTLIFMQTAALGLSAYPVFLLGKKHFSTIVSLGIALMWLLNPSVQNLSLFEFSFLPFAIPCIFFAFYFYQQKKFFPFILFALLALLVREDVALVVFIFGILAVTEKRAWQWTLFPALLSLAYFFFSMQMIRGFGGGEYKFLIYYSWLGSSWGEIVKNILLRPNDIFLRIANIGNIEMILGFLLPFLFLPLLRPKYLLLSLLVYAQILLGAAGASGLILKTQYSSLFLPSMMISFMFGLKRVPELRHPLVSTYLVRGNLGILICIAGVLYSALTLGPVIGTLKIHLVEHDPEYQKQKNNILQLVPPDASVAASYDTLANFSSRKKIYGFNYFFIGKEQFGLKPYALPEDTEFLAINLQDFLSYELQYKNTPLYGDTYSEGDERIRQKIEQSNLSAIQAWDDIVIFAPSNFQKKHETLYAVHEKLPQKIQEAKKLISKNLELDGFSLSEMQNSALSAELYWKILLPINENYFINFTLQDSSGKDISQKLLPLGSGIYPTSEWKKDTIVQTNFRLSLSRPARQNAATLSIQLVSVNTGGIFLSPDLSTKNVITKLTEVSKKILLSDIRLQYN